MLKFYYYFVVTANALCAMFGVQMYKIILYKQHFGLKNFEAQCF